MLACALESLSFYAVKLAISQVTRVASMPSTTFQSSKSIKSISILFCNVTLLKAKNDGIKYAWKGKLLAVKRSC